MLNRRLDTVYVMLEVNDKSVEVRARAIYHPGFIGSRSEPPEPAHYEIVEAQRERAGQWIDVELNLAQELEVEEAFWEQRRDACEQAHESRGDR
jgi:hypothetical protein